jgi:hypothetical protein
MIGLGENISVGAPQWYNPLVGSSDKYFFPASQERQNTIWRMYYELDPVIGSGTDMYADLPWSDYVLSGIRDPTILHMYEDSLRSINLQGVCPPITRELISRGKVIAHLLFNESKGYWTHCMIHDPSYVAVTGVGIAGLPPLLDLIPTPEMQFMARSGDPRIVEFRSKLPPDLIDAIRRGQPIPLSGMNATYIARKTSPYDVMGTSLYMRLFRVMMYEDSLFNAAIAVARRNAAPLRVFKLGDPSTGFFPDDQDFDVFLAQLEQAELDPAATLIYHFGLEVDYVGISDKFLKISEENEYITFLKLAALGIPQELVMGTQSFSSAEAGLQVTIERLAALRRKIEREWIIPKVLRPIALANQIYKTTPAQIMHNVRVKKPKLGDEDLLVPTLRWSKPLEVRDTFLMEVYKDLMSRGFISNTTYASIAGGIDLEAEVENLAKDRDLVERAQELLGPAAQTGAETSPAGIQAKQQRAALMSAAVELMQTGKSKLPEFHGIAPDDTKKIGEVLSRHGVTGAETLLERMSGYLKRRATGPTQDDIKKVIPPWTGPKAQLVSGLLEDPHAESVA